MKALSLFAFATVFLLSAALPEGKEKGLVQQDDRKGAGPLQRRKPPVKIPGPALTGDDDDEDPLKDESLLQRLADDRRRIHLTKEKNKKHTAGLNNSKGKEKSKHFANEEETQGERSKIPSYERNSS